MRAKLQITTIRSLALKGTRDVQQTHAAKPGVVHLTGASQSPRQLDGACCSPRPSWPWTPPTRATARTSVCPSSCCAPPPDFAIQYPRCVDRKVHLLEKHKTTTEQILGGDRASGIGHRASGTGYRDYCCGCGQYTIAHRGFLRAACELRNVKRR